MQRVAWRVVCAALIVGMTGSAIAAPASAPDAYTFFQWKPFLGPFHSVLLHFPIGFVVMAFLVEAYTLRHPSPESRRIVGLILLSAVVTSLLTVFLGLMRSGSAEYDLKMLATHRQYGIAVGGLMLVTLIVHRLAFPDSGADRKILRGCFRVLLLASMVTIVVAGHQGGNLTHGTNYLTKNAPRFVKELIEEPSPGDSGPAGVIASEGERFFVEKIKPVLDLKCIGCHGPEKQKSEYRLDRKAVAFAGGESGRTAVKPGDPFESNLIRAVMLPPDDDEVMPPKGKKELSPDEIVALVRWVQMGAPYPETGERSDAGGAGH